MNSEYNLLIEDDFVDYLLANGFTAYGQPSKHCIDLHCGQYIVSIKYHTASFWQYIDGDDNTAPDIHNFGSVYGIDQFDLQGWQFVLHAYGIVKIQHFAKRARQEESGIFEMLGAALKPIAAH